MGDEIQNSTLPETVLQPSNDSGRLELRSEGLVKIYGKRTVVNNVASMFDKVKLWVCLVQTEQVRLHRSI